MHIREASEVDRQRWNELVVAQDGGSFLQSWEWGELQQELPIPFWRFVVEEDGKVAGVALVIKRELPLGKSWLYVPGGLMTPEHLTLTLSSLEERVKEAAAIFVRVDPRLLDFSFGREWKKAKREVQPKETLVMDLSKSEEDLLASMHQKTRYNIRLAEKHGVQIRFSRDEKDLESFLQLAQAVSARSPFRYHAPEYYRAMRKALGSPPVQRASSAGAELEVAVAELNGQPLAVHLLISFGDTLTYVHGASSRSMREVMAPYLLQWAAARRAQLAGKRWYDFYGVGPQWPGITRFKEGFGGERRTYVGAHDYPLSPVWYFLYNLRHQ